MSAPAAPPETVILADGVTRRFTSESGDVVALDDVTLAVCEGMFASVIGPSGCGKSTLFSIIAGLDAPTSGRIQIRGDDCTGQIGVVGYMLQKDLLLPWRTILENVTLGLEVGGMDRVAARAVARPFLTRYGLGGFENAYPSQLSGGMRQRAALLRTLLCNRDPILLDEPFGALDTQTKSTMQEWLLRIWDEHRKTILFVTHDLDEALFLSDVVHVMSPRPGRFVQRLEVDLPRPRDRSVRTAPRFNELKDQLLHLLHG